ncbi:MAG: hypothetical protein FJ397_08005 [Verrucomicrobia bacterium]|nr:hypothetical protein [Verrucomicrobiota bacterium]
MLLFANVFLLFAQKQDKRLDESVSGKALRIILIAIPEIRKTSLNIEEYKVMVLEDDAEYYVILSDPNRTNMHRGSGPNLMGFEVAISKSPMRVIRSNFVK